MTKTFQDVMAEIKAKQDANPKFQEFKAIIEKKKTEMKAKKTTE